VKFLQKQRGQVDGACNIKTSILGFLVAPGAVFADVNRCNLQVESPGHITTSQTFLHS